MAQRAGTKESPFLRIAQPVPQPPLADPPATASFETFDVDAVDLAWVVGEYEKQAMVVEAQRAKTVYAMRQVADIHTYGFLTKRDALAYLVALDETTTFPAEIDQLYAAARREQILMFVDHIHKLIRIGAKNIAIEVNRSLYPPPPPKRRGLIARLLLGEE